MSTIIAKLKLPNGDPLERKWEMAETFAREDLPNFARLGLWCENLRQVYLPDSGTTIFEGKIDPAHVGDVRALLGDPD